MPSETSNIYVWVWLPGDLTPVPAGLLTPIGEKFQFSYGLRYLKLPHAVSLSPTLPLGEETFEPTGDMPLPSAIRDAAPDAWGRRVLLNRLTGDRGSNAETSNLPERIYLLKSESDRIGALDFQLTPSDYISRDTKGSLPDLLNIAEHVSRGEQLPAALHDAVLSGTGIGGARPKALVSYGGVPSLVKFSVSTDIFPSVQAEAVATSLAARAGLRTATAHAEFIGGKYSLVAERFDREANGARRLVVSALTLVGRDESGSRYSSYPELLDGMIVNAAEPENLGRELFSRIAFNMMISNTDDHLRNHAAFWDGRHLTLTPAYDLAPGATREGAESTLTLSYGRSGDKLSNLEALIGFHYEYGLTSAEARTEVDRLREVISDQFDEAVDEMRLSSAISSQVRLSFLHETVVRDLRS